MDDSIYINATCYSYIYLGWIKKYNSSIQSSDILKLEIEGFMKNFEREEKIRKEREVNQLDDDGWTTVSKK